MKLIPNWRKAHRMATVQMASLFVIWGSLPVDTQAAVLSLFNIPVERVPAILGVLIIVGRVINQPKTQE